MGVVFKKRVSTRDKRWRRRQIIIGDIMLQKGGIVNAGSIIPVEDTMIICNGCNANIYSEEMEKFGNLIYFDKRSVRLDQPYDVYCDDCLARYFPKAVEVDVLKTVSV